MTYYYSYDMVKRLNEERRARSLANYRRRLELPAADNPRPEREAEVIELVFAAHCEHDELLGA